MPVKPVLQIDHWWVNIHSGEAVYHPSDIGVHVPTALLNPQSSALLSALALRANEVCLKDDLISAAWSHEGVTDETLARAVSRLRQSFKADSAPAPVIKTVAKKGYRLIAEQIAWHDQFPTSNDSARTPRPSHAKRSWLMPAGIIGGIAVIGIASFAMFVVTQNETSTPKPSVLADSALINQADDYYMQMRRADNEMAIELYQQALSLRPSSDLGHAGLANALVQQVIRYLPSADGVNLERQSLAEALESGITQTETAQRTLARALSLADQAIELAPQSARAYKARGFVFSAMGRLDDALREYEQAVKLDPNEWRSLVNQGDILSIQGKHREAIARFEKGYTAMGEQYQKESAQIQPWYADMGALIADKYLALGESHNAETWYRRVLAIAPFNARASLGLANLLYAAGRNGEADALCQRYLARIGETLCEVSSAD